MQTTFDKSETQIIGEAIRAAFKQNDSIQSIARSVVIACQANHITTRDLQAAIKWWDAD